MITLEDFPFIERAIVQAQNSVSEDGRPRPKVGAVVVKKGEVMGEAHRGEIKSGGHAEYVLLHLKLENSDVPGATLYTTLEPCTERSPDKQPCAQRIVGRKLGRVVIGMLDPDQRIRGRGLRLLRSAGIEVDLFPLRYMERVEDQNRDFIRDREQLEAAFRAVPTIGLTLDSVTLEPAPNWEIKHKLRIHWINDGGQIHIAKPTWNAGGLGLQGDELVYRFQVWEEGRWGAELLEIDVAPNQKCRIYIGLASDPVSQEVAQQLLPIGRLGTLVLPVTAGGRQIELLIRPRSFSRVY